MEYCFENVKVDKDCVKRQEYYNDYINLIEGKYSKVDVDEKKKELLKSKIAANGRRPFEDKEIIEIIKNWDDVVKRLNELRNETEKDNGDPNEKYKEFQDYIIKNILKLDQKKRSSGSKYPEPKLAILKLAASVLPNYLCSIVNKLDMDTLIEYLQKNKLINDKCSFKDEEYFEESHFIYETIKHEYEKWAKDNDEQQTGAKCDCLPYWGILEFFKGEKVAECKEMLENNHNLILTGAPGTGKTYLAKQIAQLMIFDELKEEMSDKEEQQFREQCGFVQFHPSYDYTDFVEGLRPKNDGENIGFRREDGIFKKFCQQALKNNKKEGQSPKYVFIIDEINRGEISKIFGELFFSIDPGYRGKKGSVKTQYQNIVKDGDFKDCFFVPENVYIIGTMNDIDRSVESMDFAFRRRFAFREITAKESQTMLDNERAWKDVNKKSKKPDKRTLNKLKNRMNNLNDKIWHKDNDKCIEGFSSAYHIGASYFLKLANYSNGKSYENSAFENLWKYHLEGLLREYMRGMQDVDENIEKLKAAYNNEA